MGTSIPCAVHRPPHRKGRRCSAGECKSVVTACIKALCHEVRGAAKGVPKHAPEALQNPARHVPKPPKIEARGTPGSQHAPRSAPDQPGAPKKCPRGAQEAPKRSQEPPKSAQKPAKWRPRAAQDSPGPLQNRARRVPKRVLSAIFVGSCVRQAPPMIPESV